ncbi:hypothetical protein LCM10_12140 [Rossellomorea aquimaris]|uniref:hypothetical protein n=1 Tax=Rossellomorea aquimaris TaxID=189382 RepID=UPI001CD73EC4|nr:hypothetical protein [Rossellomorea aquimaris]MCA1055737.1 hypothetical protein [Rossellomorea aquimaris]
MMYLSEVNEWDIVKKQYRYKLKSYFGMFTSLMMIQLLAILFSFNGTGMSGGSSSSLDFEVHYFTSDILQVFMMIWAFISAIIITTKAYRNDDYAFVTNRRISHFSNVLFLFSASVIAGLTGYLAIHLFKVITFMLKDSSSIMVESLTATGLLKGIPASILYIFLFACAGYFVGMLVQFNKIFAVLVPILCVGALILDGMTGDPTLLVSALTFFGSEMSFLLFLVKILGVSFLFLLGSIGISNRLEVRK